MKPFVAFALIVLAFFGAFYMSAHFAVPGENLSAPLAPETDAFPVPEPPLGGGPAAYREYADQLATSTARPLVEATQHAQQTGQALEQHIYVDALTTTAGVAMTQQSLNQTATPLVLTATRQAQDTRTAQESTQQVFVLLSITQTGVAAHTATSLVQTQIAPVIQAQAEAARTLANTRWAWLLFAAVSSALVFLFFVVQYKEYLDDRRVKRNDESVRTRLVHREGASPLFVTKDERLLDPDKAFFPDASKPAPSTEHQERVTQRAQTVQLAREFAKALSAAPGTHTANYLANLAHLNNPPGSADALPSALTPEIRFLAQPPAYAEEVESRLLMESEGVS